MSLTDAQKASVRTYLGYSDQSRQSPSNYRLEGVWAGLSSDAVTQIQALLTQIDTIEASFGTATSASRAGIIEVDNGGVKWAPSGTATLSVLTRRGSMLVNRLATILGVPVIKDPFAVAPATGVCGLA